MIALPSDNEKLSVVILADGQYPSGGVAASMLARAQRVVCCDGAALGFTQAGGVPYAIVGDCDSLDPALLECYADIVHCNADQESNDLTKAVMFCLSEGLGDIVILGATGKREDHTLANIGLMADYILYPGIKRVRMVSSYGVLEAVTPRPGENFGEIYDALRHTCAVPDNVLKDFTFESFTGQQVSIFTPLPGVRITTHHLKYPLTSAFLFGLWPGTLNQALDNSFAIGTTGPVIVCRMFG